MQRQLSMTFYVALCASLIVLGFRSVPRLAKPAKLAGAILAGGCPIYDGANGRGAMEGMCYGDDLRETMKTRSWFFDVTDAREKVEAFYDAQLPESMRADEDDGSTSFTYRPVSAADAEYVSVIIRPGELQIHESYRLERETENAQQPSVVGQ